MTMGSTITVEHRPEVAQFLGELKERLDPVLLGENSPFQGTAVPRKTLWYSARPTPDTEVLFECYFGPGGADSWSPIDIVCRVVAPGLHERDQWHTLFKSLHARPDCLPADVTVALRSPRQVAMFVNRTWTNNENLSPELAEMIADYLQRFYVALTSENDPLVKALRPAQ